MKVSDFISWVIVFLGLKAQIFANLHEFEKIFAGIHAPVTRTRIRGYQYTSAEAILSTQICTNLRTFDHDFQCTSRQIRCR